MKWADHVGLKYRAFGAVYECMEWDQRRGLRMRLVDGEDGLLNRKPGDETWVSERAIDRTYHRIYDF